MSTTTQHHPSLQGRAIVITGAALAPRLAVSGAGILGVDLQAAHLADALSRMRGHGVQAQALAVDTAVPAVAPRAIGQAMDALERLE